MKRIILTLILMLSINAFAKDYYVSTSGDDKKDGLTEATAWRTISHAAKKAKSGDIVWIKAGNYGSENVEIKNSGKKNKPVSFIGYKNTPGDITSMYYTYAKGKPLDSKEMPMLNGGDRGKGTGIDFSKKNSITIKNIQITNYEVGIFSSSGNDNIIENILAKTFGSVNNYSGRGVHLDGFNNKLKNSIVVNSSE